MFSSRGRANVSSNLFIGFNNVNDFKDVKRRGLIGMLMFWVKDFYDVYFF